MLRSFWLGVFLYGLLIAIGALGLPAPARAQTSVAAGTTAGQFEVDDSGAATYTIPITVPAGIAGMKPEISLTYSSNGGIGLAGVGFGLTGPSEIRRCGRTLARDGIRDGVDFDQNDQFCLDGRRLVRTSAGTWRPEIEDFSLVQATGSELDPASFTVRTKSGLTMSFGATTMSRVAAQGRTDGKAIAWLLDRVSDSSGNAMTWTYASDADSGEIYPIGVQYAFASSVARAQVFFSYLKNGAPGFSYTAGSRESTGRALTSIVTLYSPTAGSGYSNARRYSLAYDVSGPTERARLISITECGLIWPSQCFPPTTFTWRSRAASGFTARSAPGYSIGGGVKSEANGISQTSYGDFDGDGRTDLYIVNSSDGTLRPSSVYLSRPDGIFELRQGPAHYVGSGDDVGVDFSRVKIADLNADGYSDVIRINGTYTTSPSSIFINDRAGGFRTPVAGPPQRVNVDNFYGYRDTSRMRFGDFNGDGVTDIAVIDGVSVTQPIAIYLNNRQGTAFTYRAGPMIFIPDGFKSSSCAVDGVKMGDFDGDGLTDFYVIPYSGTGSAVRTAVMHLNNGDGTWRSVTGMQHSVSSAGDDCGAGMGAVMAADLNGDGLTDLMNNSPVWGQNAPMTIWFSRGDGTFETASGPYHYTSSTVAGVLVDQARVKIGDINGDGLNDLLILTGANSATSRVLINRGFVSSGLARFAELPGPALYVRTGDHAANDLRRVSLVDFDGIGTLQAHRIEACCDRTSPSWVFSFGFDPAADRLVSIRNGLGAEIAIAYKPLTDASVYTRTAPGAAQWPLSDVVGPAYVVASQSSSDGLGGRRSVQYRYEDARAYLNGLGMAGLRSWSSFDQVTDARESRQMLQTFPWAGLASRIEHRIGTCLVSVTEAQYDQKLLPGTRYFPFLRTSTETGHEFDSCSAGSPAVTSKVSEFEYAEAPSVFHGNLTQSSIRLYAGSATAGTPTHTTTTRNQYLDSEASWQLGRLVRAEVYRESGGTSGTRTSSFEYDPVSGLLSSETVEPDGRAEVRLRTEYTRNANGTIATTRVKGSAIANEDRISRTLYDSNGQFPTSAVNALNHTASVTVRMDTGAPVTTKNANGLVTQNTYDTFGRQTGSVQPDGSAVTISRRSCSEGLVPACGLKAVLRVESLGSDGSRSWRDMDLLEREVASGRIGFDGTPILSFTEYNTRGEVARKSVPAFAGDPVYWTTYAYDGVGRVVTESAPRNQGGGSRTTRFDYDGLSTTQTDARGNRTTRIVDAAGQLQRVTDAAFNTTTFRYDAFDNLVATVDPKGNSIVNTYDIRGRKLSTRDPDLGTWTYGYNGFGDLLWQRDAKGKVQTFVYDALGRTRSRAETEGTTKWTWDLTSKGALSSVSSPGGYVRTHSYDALGRPIQTTETIGGVAFSFTRTYDAQGRMLTLQYPGGTSVRYGYNAYGYPASLTDGAQTTYWTGLSQDALANWTLYRTGNNVETLRSHDQANGWIQTILSGFGSASPGNVQSLNFAWDDNGNLTRRTDQRQGGLYEAFAYDGLDRLRSSRVFAVGGTAVPEVTYAYDSIGNISSRSDVGTYAYGSTRPHAVTSTSGIAGRASTYTYDANGNQLAGLGRSIEWASYNLPVRVTLGSSSVVYTYGSERQVIRAISALPATDLSANDVLYAGDGLYEQDRRGSAVTHRYLLQIGGQPIGTIVIGPPPAQAKVVQYFHYDHLDSVSAITTASGVYERHSYETFGKRRQPDWRPDGSDSLLSATHEVDRGFTDHQHADHVRLIHMGGRMYDPILGRFISPDPFVQFPDNAQAYNRYSYVLNNPLSNTDPSGFFLKRIKRELRRWEQDFRHEIRRPDSFLGTSLRLAGAAASLYCGSAYAACVAGVEAATSRAQGVTGGALLRNTGIAAGAAYGFDYVGTEYPAGSGANVIGHGVVGGLSSLAAGEKFGAGFFAAAVSGWAGPYVPESPFMGSLAASVLGGTASEIGGGKFANGAITGSFGHLFNYCQHGNCDSELEQQIYDWWPGYKFGTGLYNVANGGEMTGWEMVDGASIGLGATGRGINAAFSGGSQTVFWSGFDKGALRMAQTLGITLDKTLGGGLMNWIQFEAQWFRFSPRVWDWASATLARNATGRAIAVIRSAGRTWTEIESKILKARNIPVDHVP